MDYNAHTHKKGEEEEPHSICNLPWIIYLLAKEGRGKTEGREQNALLGRSCYGVRTKELVENGRGLKEFYI